MRPLLLVALTLAALTACVPGMGIGGDSFDPELTVTLPTLDGGQAYEAEPVPLVVEIEGAAQGATVEASFGGVPWASFHWPDTDRADLVVGQTSSTWTFLLAVTEDEDAKYPDRIERPFGVTWSNPEPMGIEVCDDTTCAPAEGWGELVGPVTLRPADPVDDALAVTWFISDAAPVVGDAADGSTPWSWPAGPAKSWDVRVHVTRAAGVDRLGYVHLVTAAN